MSDFTIKTPYRTVIRLDHTHLIVQYRDLADGACFEMQGRPGEVFERQDAGIAARLLPWDTDDYWDMTGAERVIVLKTVSEAKMKPCVYDTNNDGNCQHCHNRGGCPNMGGPYQHRSKYPPGTPDHASAGWQPN